MSKRANPHFAWVSPLVNFKKRLFSNKHKEVIANKGTNKGASETKLCSHVGEIPFSYLCCFPDLPKKWVSPPMLKNVYITYFIAEKVVNEINDFVALFYFL